MSWQEQAKGRDPDNPRQICFINPRLSLSQQEASSLQQVKIQAEERSPRPRTRLAEHPWQLHHAEESLQLWESQTNTSKPRECPQYCLNILTHTHTFSTKPGCSPTRHVRMGRQSSRGNASLRSWWTWHPCCRAHNSYKGLFSFYCAQDTTTKTHVPPHILLLNGSKKKKVILEQLEKNFTWRLKETQQHTEKV